MAHYRMEQRQRAGSRGFAPLLASDSAPFRVESRKRRHLSRLSAPSHGRLRRQQAGHAAQIDREHGQCEHIADLIATAQLDLPDCAAVLFAIAKERLDHLANDLAERVSRIPRGASVDATLAAGALARVSTASLLRFSISTCP